MFLNKLKENNEKLLRYAFDLHHNGEILPECFDLTLNALKEMEQGIICTNIQETDLAGHSQDSGVYKHILEQADEGIGKVLSVLEDDDILLIQADHGNDPNIGSSRHTRENVPLLVYKKGLQEVRLGLRKTMSDVGLQFVITLA